MICFIIIPDDFRREDVAAALLRLVCNDLAMMVDKSLLESRNADLKHVVICGGFPGNDVTRHVLTKEFISRIILRILHGGVSIFKLLLLATT